MKVVEPSFEILEETPDIYRQIEERGRICYKSEGKITPESAKPFVLSALRNGHRSVLEMATITVDCTMMGRYLLNSDGMTTGTVRAWLELGWYPHALHKLLPDIFTDPAEHTNSISVLPTPTDHWIHTHAAVKLSTNRAVTHEIVRHRLCAFLQESQRYCRYDKDQFGNEITVIRPMFFTEGSPEYDRWRRAMLISEMAYFELLETSSPQAARTVLPNSCKTEIIVYTNLQEWGHIFYQRTSNAAEPSMREIMVPLLEEFRKRWPGKFDTLQHQVRR